MAMLEAFGAPVTDAQGNSAAKTSGSEARVVAVTVEVICQTVGYFSSEKRGPARTEPACATRPMSLRIMSVIITFSARFFADAASVAAIARSSAAVMPRAAVPFIGRHNSLPPSSEKKSSGDAETIAKSSNSR